MNDMSHGQLATGAEALPVTIPTKEDGYRFVGRYLEKCATVERWAVSVLTPFERKSAHLFGQKVEAIRKVLDTEPTRFKDPARVRTLLDKFHCYAELRCDLAHSELRLAGEKNERYFIFSNSKHSVLPCRRTFTRAEMDIIIRDIGTLAASFEYQQLAT